MIGAFDAPRLSNLHCGLILIVSEILIEVFERGLPVLLVETGPVREYERKRIEIC